MHPNRAHRPLGVRYPLGYRKRDNKRSVPSGDRHNRGYPFHNRLLRLHPLVIHPLIPTDMNKTTEEIPTWSLCYLINGDATGLTDDEIRMIDRWVNDWQVQIVSPVTDEEGNAHPYFSRYPLFGLPAEVEDCDILYLNDNPSKI